MKSFNLFLFSCLLFSSTSAFAQKTYTPSQLMEMVRSGNPPEQKTPTSQYLDVEYYACRGKVDEMTSAIGSNYPVVTVLDTDVAIIKKIWTNDAAMMLACSKPDKRLVITTAQYK